MASIQFRQKGVCSNRTHVEDNCREPEVSPQIQSSSHYSVHIIREPEISPRIGDEYQAQLAPLHPRKCIKSETKSHPDQNFLIGLPVMLTWIDSLKKNTSGRESCSRASSDSYDTIIKTETMEELHRSPTAEKISKFLVPGLVDVCWNALEKDSFLLGLYIFEKKFVEVTRFVGTKDMGAVLSFYYGSFYGSREYRRWSDCRKSKGKKKIYGQRIFSGVRQHELLNRVLFGVSEECRNSIMEVSKSFRDEKILLSDYVFALKTMVGVKNLVDAISIGKGKLDLTEMPSESSRCNHSRPEIPTGKALSSLTTHEITKFLSPDYRLSKTRSSDIFWEAVWPRLLARGWHSEQPKNQGLARHCLVFLIPGIKKFSRRKLVKGEHYFDSLTDVLSKVAKEPELINLDSQEKEEEGCREKKKEEYESPNEKKSEKHNYLQPKTPSRDSGVARFTVVDTSLSGGKIKELRAFPYELSHTFTSRDRKGDNGDDIYDEKSNESKSIDILRNKKDLSENNRTRKVPKSRKTKRDNLDNGVGVIKRRRTLATAGGQEEANVYNSGVSEVIENLSSEATGPFPDKTSTAGSLRGQFDEEVENGRPRVLIDLNFPQVPEDFDIVELSGAPNGPSVLGPLPNEAQPEQPLNSNPRRVSTRYRPPTMRALQAVADGYLAVSRKRKGKNVCSHENLGSSRPAKRAGGVVGPIDPAPEFGEREITEMSSSRYSDEVVEPQVPPEANEN